MKASVFVGTSLDGFIARADGGIDWLTAAPDPTAESPGPEQDNGFQAFFDTVDALVMGRNTFDLVRSFPGWYYGDKPVFVLTSRPLDDPGSVPPTVEVVSGTPGEVVRQLEARGFGHLYVDGGLTIQAFLNEGLIDRMVVTRLPILIGTGIPLFGPTPGDIRLRHVATRTLPGGLVQSEYEVLRDR